MTIAIQLGRLSWLTSSKASLTSASFHRPIYGNTLARLLFSHSPICMNSKSYYDTKPRTTTKAKLRVGRHVQEALANGEPIVALESTVITHGLPEPENLRLALSLEEVIANMPGGRGVGGSDVATKVTPATIGIIKGQLVIGLSRGEIEFLAKVEESRPIKASRRDIPIAMALGLSAGTTVAATMAIACSLVWPMNMEFTLNQTVGASGESGGGGSNLYGVVKGGIQTGKSWQPIRIFATGGTGGVHIGAETSMDISADLFEFSRSPVCVVSSGFKSFLDTRKSLEVLETYGCTVMSLSSSWPADDEADHNNSESLSSSQAHQSGQQSRRSTDQIEGNSHENLERSPLFPGFFFESDWQGTKSPRVVDRIHEVASILYHNFEGPLNAVSNFNGQRTSGALLAVPIPREFALNLLEDPKLAAAMEGISQIDRRTDLEGKEKTPLILAELNRATGGKTMASNIGLLKNNARIGARLALSYANLQTGRVNFVSPEGAQSRATGKEGTVSGSTSECQVSPQASASLSACGPPVVVGCTMIDMHVSTRIDDRFKANPHFSGITFDGEPHLTLGGVGRNLATAIEYLGHKPIFITSLARDNLGSFALGEMEKSGLKASDDTVEGLETTAIPAGRLRVNWIGGDSCGSSGNGERKASSCFALVLLDSITGQCEYVIANMDARRDIDTKAIEFSAKQIREAPLVVMDANLTVDTMQYLIEFCHQARVPIFLEPTDVATLGRLVECLKKFVSRIHTKQNDCLDALMCLSPNVIELLEIARLFTSNNDIPQRKRIESMIEKYGSLNVEQIEEIALEVMQKHLPQLTCLLVTLDKRGVLVMMRSPDGQASLDSIKLLAHKRQLLHSKSHSRLQTNDNIVVQYVATPKPIEKPVSASGAGDSFAAGFISGLIRDMTVGECLQLAFDASQTALQDRDTISRDLKRLAASIKDSDDRK